MKAFDELGLMDKVDRLRDVLLEVLKDNRHLPSGQKVYLIERERKVDECFTGNNHG